MKSLISPLLLLYFLVNSCSQNPKTNILEINTNALTTTINNKGAFVNFTDLTTGQDYILKDSIVPVMSIKMNNQIIPPTSAIANGNELILDFKENVRAHLKLEEKETHFTIELIALNQKDKVQLIVWGPYPNRIKKTIGETIGVVRGDEFALGIQSLNIKTLGGYPWHESDKKLRLRVPNENNSNNTTSDINGNLYRVEAAKPTPTGSSLQAYCRNRNKARFFNVLGYDKIIAPKYKDGGVIGSKIALFGCPVQETLQTIGQIEIAEGLPHPMLNGQWVKTAPSASASYIISSFTERNINQAIAVTKKAGLNYLYHFGKTFENWGQFRLNREKFPNGRQGLKKCVEIAEAAGIKLGVHTLSNFITTNDPYVTPIPDKRLAKVGSSTITTNVDATQTELRIASPQFFNQKKASSLNTVMINQELIQYDSVSKSPPWKLLGCQRGAFNTKASMHSSGDSIGRLLDHSYKVFLTNADLTKEMSKNMANLYNQTGLKQISFDGLKGNLSTGLGTYGESLMPYTWYNALSEKDNLIIDGSITTHFFWHIYTRMNWGEPWYDGFRESQTERRMNNQAYFKRNFMPGMLGWFKMTSKTSIEDIEWLLTRAAAYNAGFAFIVNEEAIQQNGFSDRILERIRFWENIRQKGLFTESQIEIMKDLNTEFTLINSAENEFDLHQVNSAKFTHTQKPKQAAEIIQSKFNFNHKGNNQAINFILQAVDSEVDHISFRIDHQKTIEFPMALKANQILKYRGDNKVVVYDNNWNFIKDYQVSVSDFKVNQGEHRLTFSCQFKKAGKAAKVDLEVRTLEPPEKISLE